MAAAVGRDERSGDVAILEHAYEQQRILVTLDKDFGELAIAFGHSHAGIIRLHGISAQEQGPTTVAVLARYSEELEAGAIVTVEPGRVRVRT